MLHLPYPSRRYPTVAARGMAATTQPLAALAGLDVLRDGGSAVDAAVAMAAMLTVVEPTSNGIGSDAFALVWEDGRLHGLNGSGRAPAAMTIERLRGEGHETVPTLGWLPVTVPGTPRAWADLHARFGRLSFERVLAPAIETARGGYAVTPVVAHYWARAAEAYARSDDPALAGWAECFAANGRAPRAGELWRSEAMAATLREIAASGAASFYEGALAERIARYAAETGGLITGDDLAAHESEWVEPISASFRGHELWEIPPNGQGLTALIALRLLDGFEIERYPRDSVEALHLQVEAMKLAFADAERYIADPRHAEVPTAALLSEEYTETRRALIDPQRAAAPMAGEPPRGGTVYLCAADGDGQMVSFIQSNYMGFGSGVVVPGTGIALQNRGANFTLDAAHPNALAPGKRPYHTIIPAFLTREGEAVGPFGVMGGFMQPQGHLQLTLNTLAWGMNPQAALDAPRWQVTGGLDVMLEAGTPRATVEAMARLGHRVTLTAESGHFGRGQIIWRGPHGGYVGGTEPRADSLIVGY